MGKKRKATQEHVPYAFSVAAAFLYFAVNSKKLEDNLLSIIVFMAVVALFGYLGQSIFQRFKHGTEFRQRLLLLGVGFAVFIVSIASLMVIIPWL